MKSLTTIRSSILDSTGVIDIGWKSDGMHGDATLATGRIEARFHWFGTTGDEMDRFIMSISGLANIGAPIRNKKDGYRQLNVRQLGSLYAPGITAVNATWIEREFNACQTPRSMYPSIFNHFWNIALADSGAGAAHIDQTNFCINVKVIFEWTKTHHFLVKIHFFLGRGQPPPKTPPSTVHPHYKVLDPPLRYSGISVASDWFSTVLVSEWAFLTTFCFPLGTPLGQSR